MGPVAARALKRVGKGNVIAVFDHCFYLSLKNTYICLGNSNFSDGPLNIVSSASDKKIGSLVAYGLGIRLTSRTTH